MINVKLSTVGLVVVALIGTISMLIPLQIVFASEDDDSSDESSISPTPSQRRCLEQGFVGALSGSHAGPAGAFVGGFIAGGLCALHK